MKPHAAPLSADVPPPGLPAGLAMPDGAGPAYRRLAGRLGGLIESGEIAPGTALPTERDLARFLGVGRVTVRAAYRMLSADGLLERKQGSGTFVRGAVRRIEQPLWRLTSFSQEIRRRGMVPGARLLALTRSRPAAGEMVALGLAGDEPVVRLKRVRLADGLPLAVETSAVPARFLADLPRDPGSLYACLRARGHGPVRATQRLGAINLDGASAALLDLETGSAALRIERVAYLACGAAVEYTRSLYRGDAYDFVAELNQGEPS